MFDVDWCLCVKKVCGYARRSLWLWMKNFMIMVWSRFILMIWSSSMKMLKGYGQAIFLEGYGSNFLWLVTLYLYTFMIRLQEEFWEGRLGKVIKVEENGFPIAINGHIMIGWSLACIIHIHRLLAKRTWCMNFLVWLALVSCFACMDACFVCLHWLYVWSITLVIHASFACIVLIPCCCLFMQVVVAYLCMLAIVYASLHVIYCCMSMHASCCVCELVCELLLHVYTC